MKSRKGFTLIELMVVILIVGILAAVAVPIMRGRIDSAKWSEGKAMMGSLGTAIRAYAAEQGSVGYANPTLAQLGFSNADLTGTYFAVGNYSWTSTYAGGPPPVLLFTITATAGTGITSPASFELTQAGAWTIP
jgi:prepilin-type N-terminal cleavage/methylation domain-containing protein